MAEMKTFNGYEVVDAKARDDIGDIKADINGIKADMSEAFEYVNLFDKSAASIDIWLKAADGSIHPLNDYYVSDFIPVVIGKTYSYKTPVEGQGTDAATKLAVYNSSKEYNGFITGTVSGDIITVPITTEKVNITVYTEDIAYVRFNTNVSQIDEAMFVEGTDYPEGYYEYGEKCLSGDIKLKDSHFGNIKKDITDIKADINGIKDDMSEIIEYVNLFDKNAVNVDSWLRVADGTIHPLTGCCVSDFIPVVIGKTYTYKTAGGQGDNAVKLVVYNSNKVYNGYITGTASGDIITVPITTDTVGITVKTSDIAFVRFNVDKSQIENAMFVEGTEYPVMYYEYGEKCLNDDVKLRLSHLAQIPQKESALLGKKIAYNGDSICESRTDPSSRVYNGGGYAKIISDLTGGTYENRAISGGVLVSATPDEIEAEETYIARHICLDVEHMADDADLICFEGGINDYWKDVPLGEFDDKDFEGELVDTTLSGALESIFRKAINKWVGKPICFIIVHKITTTAYTVNDAGYTFKQARERIIQICEKYSIPYYDAFTKSGLNPYMDVHNREFMIKAVNGNPDGCHPNEEGYKKYYVPQLIKFFESLL